MPGFNQCAQFFRRTETAGRRIQTGCLIAPRAVKRVFGNGQKFDMGEAHVFDVCDQFFGQLFVSQPEIIFGIAFPRTQMHFINADRRINGVGTGAESRVLPLFPANRARQTRYSDATLHQRHTGRLFHEHRRWHRGFQICRGR